MNEFKTAYYITLSCVLLLNLLTLDFDPWFIFIPYTGLLLLGFWDLSSRAIRLHNTQAREVIYAENE